MAGGLMNLISYGTGNIILNGNPKKTFFKVKYNKYTNFGMQRIRMDFRGLRQLQYSSSTTMEFKIPRVGDLLHDTYIVVNLPNIWSPLHMNTDASCVPYEFQWTENIACAMIEDITIHSGGNILNRYSGEYLHFIKERDLNETKKKLWNRMTGNTPDMTDPAAYHRSKEYKDNKYYDVYKYPSSKWNATSVNREPSIRGKQIIIPLASWFSISSKMALPLVSVQYQTINISITFAPIKNLYRVRNILDPSNNYPHVAPKTGNMYEMYRFINPPMDELASGGHTNYPNNRNDWNSDIHLIGTFIFLDKQEQAVFARDEQRYLIKEVHEEDYLNVTGSQAINLQSRNMVIDWMFRFRRTDVYQRSEWFNYSNWPYKDQIPVRPVLDTTTPKATGVNSIYYYDLLHTSNAKEILLDLAIQMDGKYREDIMNSSVYKWLEKTTRTTGSAEDGIYCYNFCLNSNKGETQPSGAINVNKFSKISFNFNTIEPPTNPLASFNVICDDETNDIIGIQKNNASLYKYNFDLHLIEERYNVIVIQNGSIGLLYAR
jgi:hypothetical protein